MAIPANSLYRGLNSARKFSLKTHQAFFALCNEFGSDKVAGWSKLPTAPKLVNGVWTRVYRHPISKGDLPDLQDCFVL